VITDSAKKACVFCNGPLDNPARVKTIARDCGLLIAADGGARHLLDIGLAPQVIIGDMDSIGSDLWKDNDAIQRIQYPADKDKSDAEIGVEHALEHGYEQVILVAATGGRLDHTVANIALAAAYPGQIVILDGTSSLVALDKGKRCILRGTIGTVVSLIPHTSDRLTVRTNGLKYALQDECLSGATHGLSNELSQTHACICASGGILLVYIESQEYISSSESE